MARDWICLIVASIASAALIRPDRARRALVWILPFAGARLLAMHRDALPWQRLAAASLAMIYIVKSAMLASYSFDKAKTMRSLVYWVWPGMDPERLTKKAEPCERDARPFARGLVYIGLGSALLLAAALAPIGTMAAGWVGLFALLLIVHFGISELFLTGFRLSGLAVRPLFDRPLSAETLNEFWTRRWNVPFVEMNRRLFLPWLLHRLGYRGAILGVFLISGLLHEMAISYPSGGGWGMPTAYFAIQGVLVLIERRLNIRSRVFVWTAILAPISLVFTAQFRSAFIMSLLTAIHRMLVSQSLGWYFDHCLWIMGAAHFLVLVASFQVPSKLHWREELPRLSPFNRKLMHAYGAFIVLTIGTFGVFTLAMHRDLMSGSPAAVFLAGFIAVFWLLRIALDVFYYKSEDWPKGPQFVVGHALLTALFVFLSLSYGGLVIWRLVA